MWVCFPHRMALGRFSNLNRAEKALCVFACGVLLCFFIFSIMALYWNTLLLALQFAIIGTAFATLAVLLAVLLEQFWDLLPAFCLLMTGIVDFGILLRRMPPMAEHSTEAVMLIVSVVAIGFVLMAVDVGWNLQKRWKATLAEHSSDPVLAVNYERYQQALAAVKLDCVQAILMILWINRAQTPIGYRLIGSAFGLGNLLSAPLTFYSMREDKKELTGILGLTMLPFPLFVIYVLQNDLELRERSIPIIGLLCRIVMLVHLGVHFRRIQAGMQASVQSRGYRCDLVVMPPNPDLHEQDSRESAGSAAASGGYGAVGDTIPLNVIVKPPPPAATYMWDPEA